MNWPYIKRTLEKEQQADDYRDRLGLTSGAMGKPVDRAMLTPEETQDSKEQEDEEPSKKSAPSR